MYDSLTMAKIASYTVPNDPTPFTSVARNDKIFGGRENGDIIVLNTTLSNPKALMCHECKVSDLAAKNERLLSIDMAGILVVWDTVNLNQICTYRAGDGSPGISVRWWGSKVLSAFGNGKLYIHNLLTGALETEFSSHRRTILAVDVQGNQVVTAGADTFINVFELANCGDRNEVKCTHSFQLPDRIVCGVQWIQKFVLCTAYDSPLLQVIDISALD